MMETHYISSPEIESVGYDADNGDLSIRFRDGSAKEFRNIPKETYVALMQSGSKMEFVQKRIETT
ncbi:KTSC domain-containing protein [Leptospira kmetyi]|uniref:KTSC domain-containing protein n=1 Tax=Leptospira kmetyi TaxID=408139 RepID=A0A2M9XPY2_9LEPT|nr:KTSC domain-containing protein [Leptospira kmetyi]AYV55549.1 KTSC domain-containing protein [Leptospira kmetyi]EQA51804.1 KTSC domain protein [Leptospira kmetyi serovar Malaysia str. Bejo-Iso9]PJZ29367.1 KTSC domain-containing protein [Leptospira kmetyi]PJZ41355.1 KTSC domain-containing protein [Leptospira kmetyi]TGK16653.1 KTSC domain-containing protein [Leptospira kmetyi]